MKVKRLVTLLAASLAITGAALAQTVTVALDVDPPNLDPAFSTAFVDRQIHHNVFDKLLDVDESMQIIPYLVTSWEASEDGLVYTMHLQEGVTFHDGTQLDAEAVKYNLDRYRQPGTFRETELSEVVAVEVVDPLTFEVHLNQPSPAFLGSLTDRSGRN